MNPGRELDTLVAEKVMGWVRQHDIWYSPQYQMNQKFDCPPRYSTDISAAWQVVEKLLKDGHYVDLEMGDSEGSAFVDVSIDYVGHTTGESVPHAICLAALKACGVEI